MAKKTFTSDAARVFMLSGDAPEAMSEDEKQAVLSESRAIAKSASEARAEVRKAKAEPKAESEPQARISIYVPKSVQIELKQEAAAADMTISSYLLSLIEKGRRA